MPYRAPVEEIIHTLNGIAGLKAAREAGHFQDLTDDLVTAILVEAGKFANDELAPMNAPGDTHGTPITDGVVTMPPGWRETYRRWAEGGWNALSGPIDHGGQGLPTMLQMATAEMWAASNLAFGLGPLLTTGAVEALNAHGSDHLKDRFLPKMVAGEWTGTMNLTEPQAGSDLNALRTRAERRDDGTYRIKGQKIYITFGEHDLTDNIVHLVLARLPDAPEGTRGISLFLVPKFLVNDDGSLGARNDVHCHSVEHKLGIHASPTCTMLYGDGKHTAANDGAIGYLIGQENRGLRCMFTMMNNARLAVGIQGVAVADAATQKAIEYARERRQGKAPDGSSNGAMSPIIEHPDIARSLLTMRALTEASRAICYSCAHAIDLAHATTGDDQVKWKARADLLTPVAKAYSTDIGVDVASLGVQVHGGMGFIEETGAAQYLRDVRITPIYEGTNGIQSIDLVTRKLLIGDGAAVAGLFDEYSDLIERASSSNTPGLSLAANALTEALRDLREATDWLRTALTQGRTDEALAGATPYLRLFGLVAGGSYLIKSALASHSESEARRRAGLAEFYALHEVTAASGLKTTVMEGAHSVLSTGDVLAAM